MSLEPAQSVNPNDPGACAVCLSMSSQYISLEPGESVNPCAWSLGSLSIQINLEPGESVNPSALTILLDITPLLVNKYMD